MHVRVSGEWALRSQTVNIVCAMDSDATDARWNGGRSLQLGSRFIKRPETTNAPPPPYSVQMAGFQLNTRHLESVVCVLVPFVRVEGGGPGVQVQKRKGDKTQKRARREPVDVALLACGCVLIGRNSTMSTVQCGLNAVRCEI